MPRTYRRRKRSYLRRGASALNIAVKAIKGVRYLKSITNSERKFKGSGTVTATIDDAGTVQPLLELNDGPADGERTGLSVKWVDFKFRYVAKINATSQTDTQMRIILFCDKQQVSDSDTNVGNVLEGVTTYAPINNKLGLSRFRILYDRQISLNSVNRSTIIVNRNFKVSIKTRYNGIAFTDIQKNGIYLLLLSGETANLPTFVFNFSGHYIDN